LKIMGSLLAPFADETYFPSVKLKNRLTILDHYFIFALTWSLGGSVASQSLRNFDVSLRKLLMEAKEVIRNSTFLINKCSSTFIYFEMMHILFREKFFIDSNQKNLL